MRRVKETDKAERPTAQRVNIGRKRQTERDGQKERETDRER